MKWGVAHFHMCLEGVKVKNNNYKKEPYKLIEDILDMKMELYQKIWFMRWWNINKKENYKVFKKHINTMKKG